MSDYYKLSLEILIQLLKGEGYENWQKWLSEDIRLWETEKSTEHHLRAYGGTGSFNDVPLGTNDLGSIWKNKLFGTIQTLAYSFAKGEISSAPIEENFYAYGSKELSGWRCRDCGDAKIKEKDIENYISSLFLPKIIVKYIKSDKLIEILDIDKLINSEEVIQKRKEIKTLIQKSAIELTNSAEWLWTCPKCQSKETCAYRWILNENDTNLIEADNNLSLNSPQ
jgi:hypothetical protein